MHYLWFYYQNIGHSVIHLNLNSIIDFHIVVEQASPVLS